MRSRILQYAGSVASWSALFLCLVTLAYQLAPHWPILCLFSDLKTLITDQHDGRDFPMWRLIFALFMAMTVTGVSWLSFHRYRNTSRSTLPIAAVILTFAVLAFYPDIRQVVLSTALRSDSSTIVIEAVIEPGSTDPDSPRPVRLSVGARLAGVAWRNGVVWFADAEPCHVDLPSEVARTLAAESDLFSLPAELEPEGALAHDWMRVSFFAGQSELNVFGLQRSGRHSARFRRVVSTILEGARRIGIDLPGCVSALEHELDPRNWFAPSRPAADVAGEADSLAFLTPEAFCFFLRDASPGAHHHLGLRCRSARRRHLLRIRPVQPPHRGGGAQPAALRDRLRPSRPGDRDPPVRTSTPSSAISSRPSCPKATSSSTAMTTPAG
jgi:hypothetical protein